MTMVWHKSKVFIYLVAASLSLNGGVAAEFLPEPEIQDQIAMETLHLGSATVAKVNPGRGRDGAKEENGAKDERYASAYIHGVLERGEVGFNKEEDFQNKNHANSDQSEVRAFAQEGSGATKGAFGHEESGSRKETTAGGKEASSHGESGAFKRGYDDKGFNKTQDAKEFGKDRRYFLDRATSESDQYGDSITKTYKINKGSNKEGGSTSGDVSKIVKEEEVKSPLREESGKRSVAMSDHGNRKGHLHSSGDKQNSRYGSGALGSESKPPTLKQKRESDPTQLALASEVQYIETRMNILPKRDILPEISFMTPHSPAHHLPLSPHKSDSQQNPQTVVLPAQNTPQQILHSQPPQSTPTSYQSFASVDNLNNKVLYIFHPSTENYVKGTNNQNNQHLVTTNQPQHSTAPVNFVSVSLHTPTQDSSQRGENIHPQHNTNNHNVAENPQHNQVYDRRTPSNPRDSRPQEEHLRNTPNPNHHYNRTPQNSHQRHDYQASSTGPISSPRPNEQRSYYTNQPPRQSTQTEVDYRDNPRHNENRPRPPHSEASASHHQNKKDVNEEPSKFKRNKWSQPSYQPHHYTTQDKDSHASYQAPARNQQSNTNTQTEDHPRNHRTEESQHTGRDPPPNKYHRDSTSYSQPLNYKESHVSPAHPNHPSKSHQHSTRTHQDYQQPSPNRENESSHQHNHQTHDDYQQPSLHQENQPSPNYDSRSDTYSKPRKSNPNHSEPKGRQNDKLSEPKKAYNNLHKEYETKNYDTDFIPDSFYNRNHNQAFNPPANSKNDVAYENESRQRHPEETELKREQTRQNDPTHKSQHAYEEIPSRTESVNHQSPTAKPNILPPPPQKQTHVPEQNFRGNKKFAPRKRTRKIRRRLRPENRPVHPTQPAKVLYLNQPHNTLHAYNNIRTSIGNKVFGVHGAPVKRNNFQQQPPLQTPANFNPQLYLISGIVGGNAPTRQTNFVHYPQNAALQPPQPAVKISYGRAGAPQQQRSEHQAAQSLNPVSSFLHLPAFQKKTQPEKAQESTVNKQTKPVEYNQSNITQNQFLNTQFNQKTSHTNDPQVQSRLHTNPNRETTQVPESIKGDSAHLYHSNNARSSLHYENQDSQNNPKIGNSEVENHYSGDTPPQVHVERGENREVPNSYRTSGNKAQPSGSSLQSSIQEAESYSRLEIPKFETFGDFYQR